MLTKKDPSVGIKIILKNYEHIKCTEHFNHMLHVKQIYTPTVL